MKKGSYFAPSFLHKKHFSILHNFFRDNLLQGFEVSALVFFGYDINGIHNNRVFSRCISNLILVVNEDVAKSLHLDEHLSIQIPIYGLLTERNIIGKCIISLKWRLLSVIIIYVMII